MPGIKKVCEVFIDLTRTIAKSANKSGTKVLQIKHDIPMLVNPCTAGKTNPIYAITKNGLTAVETQGELGNISVRLADFYKRKEDPIKAFFERLLPDCDGTIRTKGANSIYSKLERKILSKKKDLIITSDSQAKSMIGDGVGVRIIMPSLKKGELQEVLSTCKLNLHIEGQGLRTLTAQEQKILTKIFKGEKVSKMEMKSVEGLINPVKIALAERQSQPVVDRLLSGSYQLALDEGRMTLKEMERLVKKGELSEEVFNTVKKNQEMKEFLETFSQTELRQMRDSGEISEAFYQELQEAKPFDGLNITELSNYRGSDGIAYFSNAQIQQIKAMQIHTGKKFNIYTACENISGRATSEMTPKIEKLKDLNNKISQLRKSNAPQAEIEKLEQEFTNLQKKYGLEGIDRSALDTEAIKASGYTTAQMNFTMADGTTGELQIRGAADFAEVEHIAYDARLGKNTLGRDFDEYIEAVQSLSESQYETYNKYIKECYNYARNAELGIQLPAPQLPKGLAQILSQKSMKFLHAKHVAAEKEIEKTFTPHLQLVA